MSKDDEVKKEIKDAARCVFFKWGLNKTTMEDIAHQAGKGKSTLYYYFKSKEDIFEHVLLDELNGIILKATKTIQDVDSPRDKLKQYLKTTFEEIKKTVSVYALIKGEIKGNDKLIKNIRQRYDQSEEAIILDILKLGVKIHEFNSLKNMDLDMAANVIVGIIRSLELNFFLENEDDDKMDIAMRLITQGL